MAMETRPTCLDCNSEAPETNTEYTLISTLGWRLARGQAHDGSFALVWRCPDCWSKHKELTGAAPHEEDV
jgi:hypothetical protein